MVYIKFYIYIKNIHQMKNYMSKQGDNQNSINKKSRDIKYTILKPLFDNLIEINRELNSYNFKIKLEKINTHK